MPKNTFSVSEGAPLKTLKLFFWQNEKYMRIFWCFTVKITFMKQHQCIVRVKILNWLRNKFFMDVEKKIKHFAKKKICFFNRAPSDTLKKNQGK